MTTGKKIEKLRKQHGFTTEELGKKLNVSRQTIYKWESDSAFPDTPHLKQLATIFETTTDYLLYETAEKPPVQQISGPETRPQVEVVAEAPVEFGCLSCGKMIRKGEPSFDAKKYIRPKLGKRFFNHAVATGKICASCSKKNASQIRKDAIKNRRLRDDKANTKLIWNFVALAILLTLTLIISITLYAQRPSPAVGTIALVTGLLTTFAVPTIILDNTFVTDVFIEIMTWGFVKFPGIIFSMNFGGIVFLIIMKIVLFLLGLTLIAGAFGLAISIAGIFSIFVYPIALKRNIQGELE